MPWELVEDETPQESGLKSFGKEAGRFVGRQAYNIGTRIAGTPGDIMSLVNEFIARPVTEFVEQGPSLPYEQTFMGQAFPTTETQRKNIEPFFGESIKPRNEVERFTDDVLEDTSMLFSPGGALKTGGKVMNKLFKSLAKSTGANIVGESVKQVSDSEEAGAATKIGALFLSSLLDQEGTAKQIGKLYKQAEAKLPQGATTSSKTLNKQLNSLKTNITKGRPTENLAASEKFVLDEIEKVERLSTNGIIPVDQAWAQKRSLSENLTKLYQNVPGRKDRKRAKNLAKQVNGFLRETIRDYGKKNPEFYKPFKEADEAFGTIERSNWMSNWAERNISRSPATLGLVHFVSGPLGMSVTGGVGGLAAANQVGKLAYRVSKSPALAKMYAKTVKAAASEDVVAFNKYLNELDEALQKEENEEFWEFID